MAKVIDSARFRFLPCTCSRVIITAAAVTIIFFSVLELASIVRKHSQRSEKNPTVDPRTTTKSPLTEIAQGVFLVHTIRDRRNRGEEIRALVYAQRPNYNEECGMKNGIRMRASWFEMSDNGSSSLWKAFYLSCNLPDIFFEDMLIESLAFVEHPLNDEAPRLGFRNTGVDIDYDLPFDDPLEFELFFGLCVPLLDADKFSAPDVVEFVEINRKLGVERITFVLSRETLSTDMTAALEHYSEDLLVDLVYFTLPFPSDQVERSGLNVARDICLHRHMQTTELLGFTTLREFFLPLENATMREAMRTFPYYQSGLIKISAVEVPMRSNAQPLSMTNKFSMERLNHTVTRGIVRPRKIVEMGPNFAYHLINSGRQVVFENNAKHIVLYRLVDDTVPESMVDDRSITEVVPALADVYERISKNIDAVLARLPTDSPNIQFDAL